MKRLFSTQIEVDVSEVDGVEELVRVDFVVDLEMIFSLRRAASGNENVTIAVVKDGIYRLLTPFDVVLTAWEEYMQGQETFKYRLN